jgi:hypothetical protein
MLMDNQILRCYQQKIELNCSNGAILTIGSSTIRFDSFGRDYIFEPSKEEIIMTFQNR